MPIASCQLMNKSRDMGHLLPILPIKAEDRTSTSLWSAARCDCVYPALRLVMTQPFRFEQVKTDTVVDC
ncbi:hypothetical protein KCU62_g126, partial [Aureobasidium sp. EXF-3399]